MKRGCGSGQVPTRSVSIVWIMSQSAFALGVRDARSGLPYRSNYEQWETNSQWNYERGRLWAALAPRDIALRKGDGINPDAMRYYEKSVI